MAEVYYQAMKAAADNVAASTRFMLARAPSNPFWDPTKVANGNGGFLPSPAGFATGFPELSAAQNAFDAAYKRAQELNHPDAGAAGGLINSFRTLNRMLKQDEEKPRPGTNRHE